MSLDAETLALIRDEIRKAMTRPLRPATFAERTGDAAGLVVEDANTVATDVLIGGDVLVEPGDRVVMAQFGSDWVVLASLTPHWPNEIQYEFVGAGQTTTSGSYVDAPGLPAVADRTFVKLRDSSSVIVRCDATAISSAVNTELRWGTSLTSLETGVVYGPYQLSSWFSSDPNRTPHGHQIKLSGLPAGQFDAKLLWSRPQGAGVITVTADDRYQFNVREAAP